jgi:hypothetical protein
VSYALDAYIREEEWKAGACNHATDNSQKFSAAFVFYSNNIITHNSLFVLAPERNPSQRTTMAESNSLPEVNPPQHATMAESNPFPEMNPPQHDTGALIDYYDEIPTYETATVEKYLKEAIIGT